MISQLSSSAIKTFPHGETVERQPDQPALWHLRDAPTLLVWLEGKKGFNVSAPIDVDKVAELLKIQVENDYSLGCRGIIGEIFFRNGCPIIKIDPRQNSYLPRRRFTLAHEIGHYCLHSVESRQGFADSQETMGRTATYWDPCETAANIFAAQLLMPMNLVLKEAQNVIAVYQSQVGKKNMDFYAFIRAIATKFVVSDMAMEYRLRSVGISQRTVRSN